ncbi:cation diffusion facilitator family transporter [Pseudomonas sp. JM0905a]|uniref:Cation diffusion facilitator family transporter n=1 Tax=Metapseudomonas resinovorans TaxID=53412 RepID=A0ABT4Y007_METRE|nr:MULTISPECIES: cation diffusion facilitator family transporter [Pseudomonas]MBD2835640.1 cation diffusion facilitator family transporter [Pseudomonas sp. JM0905a]MDA8482165.1 cation diffusion facilitator family transporter [Pseudomonas resinovorans]
MTSPRQHAQLLRLATRASLAVAITLVMAKAIAWAMSGSVSLLAGLTDSLMDSAASLLNLLAVRYALKPADDDHRYGHGKAEALAGLAQALFISVSAVLVAAQAYERLNDPQPLEAEMLGIGVMLLSLALTAGLLMLQRRVIRVTGSTAIRADSLHYRSDLLLNSGILLALILASLGWQQADGLFGLGIAGYILWSAIGIARESISVLMDEELSPTISADMHRLACEVPGVLGAHDLRTRISGNHWYVQLHLELPGELTLSRAHALCEQAEKAITSHYPRAEVLVHADPSEVVKHD